MQFWLMKSEPDVFSLDDLEKAPGQRSMWDGVRNYQARNYMRDQMKTGDRAFFYYSNHDPAGIWGVVEIIGPAYPDPTQFDPTSKYFDPKSREDNPRWMLIDVRFLYRFPQPVTRDAMKNNPQLDGMLVMRPGNRLSITPVEPKHWYVIHKMAGFTPERK
jgi:predicted RNA-binding protein with PUA-like domain